MRLAVAFLVGVVFVAGALAQQSKDAKPARRYGIEPNLESYPQATPKEALASVLQAIDQNRVNYLLAQLADPDFVDRRVKALGGKFEELVRETTAKLADDPGAVKELRRFLKEGDWEERSDTASAQVKDLKDRRVFFRKIGGRWFFENRQKAEEEAR